MKFRWLGTIGLASALALTACGAAGGGGTGGEGGEGSEGGEGGSTTLQVAAVPSGALEFEETELTAPANQAFEVEFTNEAPLSHNWVLVEQGQEQTVASAAEPTGEVPEDTAGLIVAGNPIQGETETINVDALEPGTYSYICTVAGHYPSMQGTLTVE